MKLLIVHNRYLQRGGEDVVVDDEIALLRRHGHAVQTLIEDNLAVAALPAWQAGAAMLWSRAAARRVQQLCAQFKPDVMHCHNTFARLSPSVIWAARRAGVPVVQTLHNFRLLCVNAMLLRDGRPCEDCVGHLPWRGAVHRCFRGSAAQSAALAGMITLHRLLGSHVRQVARFIALSEHARGKLVEGGLPAQRIVVKPNFVADPGVGDGPRDGLLYVGRLSAEKGIEWLMQASQRAGCRVTLIGGGPLDVACRAHAAFDCLGPQPPEQVYAAMRRSRALLLPSLSYEAMPRVLVEAYACGLPVVASRLGALAELVEHRRCGLLVEPRDADSLADAMREAQTGAELAAWSQRARARYEALYTPQAAHDALMQIYRQALATTLG